jgi:hypothetical protein
MKYCENFVWTERKNNKIEFTMAKNHVLLLLTLTFNMKTKHKMVLLKEPRSRPHHTSYHRKINETPKTNFGFSSFLLLQSRQKEKSLSPNLNDRLPKV